MSQVFFDVDLFEAAALSTSSFPFIASAFFRRVFFWAFFVAVRTATAGEEEPR